MRAYKHSNKRIVPRDKKGRFTRITLDCEICKFCGAILLPEITDGMKQYPKTCHSCGKERE